MVWELELTFSLLYKLKSMCTEEMHIQTTLMALQSEMVIRAPAELELSAF